MTGDSEQVTAEIEWSGGHRISGQPIRPVARLENCRTISSWPPACWNSTTSPCLPPGSHNTSTPRDCDHRRDSRSSGSKQFRILSRGLVPRAAGPGLRHPDHTHGGYPTWPGNWPCRRSPSTTGSSAAGSPRTSNPAPGTRRWLITADHAELERLRELRRLPHGYHTRRRWHPDPRPADRNDHPTEPKL